MDWTSWRGEFPILARRNYLNSCSLGALSHRAQRRVLDFQEEWHEHGAAAWYRLWLARLDELRARVGRMLGAGPGDIALVPSISAGLAVVASTGLAGSGALDFRRRNRVIVADLDFPTLAYAFMARPELDVVRVPSDDGATIDLRRFEDAVDERTAFIATSHVFFTTGAIQDVSALAEIAHRRGALLLVDAYQGTGQVPLDVAAAGVDLLLTGPLKWLMGGPGLAYLYVRPGLLPALTPTAGGWFGDVDPFAFDITRFTPRDDARRFELGTPALPTVHAALGAQEIVDEIGVPAIRARNRTLTERLIDGARAAGFAVRCAPAAADRSAIVMIGDDDARGAVAYLDRQDIIVDARPGHVRLSPHFYNTADDVDAALAALRAWSAR
jgi:kynureninase